MCAPSLCSAPEASASTERGRPWRRRGVDLVNVKPTSCLQLIFVGLVGLTCFTACSDDESSDVCNQFSAPQILPSERPVCVDATFVDSVITRPVLLENRGASDLVIDDMMLELQGNARGHFSLQGIDQTTVSCPEEAAVGIEYAPTQPGWDTATLVIRSNAENFPTLEIFYLALAVPENDPNFVVPPKPPEAVGSDNSETCPDLDVTP